MCPYSGEYQGSACRGTRCAMFDIGLCLGYHRAEVTAGAWGNLVLPISPYLCGRIEDAAPTIGTGARRVARCVWQQQRRCHTPGHHTPGSNGCAERPGSAGCIPGTRQLSRALSGLRCEGSAKMVYYGSHDSRWQPRRVRGRCGKWVSPTFLVVRVPAGAALALPQRAYTAARNR